MEYNESQTKPESTRKFLIQQVQEQSSLCDVIVKTGYWEKKYHRCVLVTSPFFDHVINDNFLEKQTGKIEISIGTPISLETAIMFLYGQKPKFNEENIENILHMAEFLLIPNLKSACIAWLKSLTITEEICLRFLQLSSIYDFEIPECTRYIEKHLPEMLLNPQMVNLTKDSIQLLFSDKRLSYVQMDDKLSFIFKWLDANPDARKLYIHELLVDINFCDVSKPFLQELVQNPDLAGLIKVRPPSVVPLNFHRGLIMKGGRYDRSIWCLDLERDQWFRVVSKSFEEEKTYHYQEISGTFTRDSESMICFVRRYPQYSILVLDLKMDTCSKINLIECDKNFELKRIDNLTFDKGMCVYYVNETKHLDKKMLKVHNVESMFKGFRVHPLFFKTSTLFIGQMVKGDDYIEMSPLLSFKYDEILEFFIIQRAIVIIFKSNKYVLIYDLDESSLKKIEQPTECNDKLANFKEGFVIYNEKRCISFARLNGPCLKKKYEVVEIPFERNKFVHIKYFLCGQMFYRYYRRSSNENFVFECIPFQTMLFRKPDGPFTWKQLPLPIEANLCNYDTVKDRCFEICLPKSMLRCNIECPHCKVRIRETVISRNAYNFDSDDYIYRDSSDDDYYYHPSSIDYSYDSDSDY